VVTMVVEVFVMNAFPLSLGGCLKLIVVFEFAYRLASYPFSFLYCSVALHLLGIGVAFVVYLTVCV
jgi:hypothetical protein